MDDLIKELEGLKDTLRFDDYKDWCYVQLTIDKAIKAINDRSEILLPKRLSNQAYHNAKKLTYQGFVDWWDSQVKEPLIK